MGAGTARIGLICPADHETFSDVAARLRRRGHDVHFLPVGEELDPGTLDGLDLLANKKIRWASLHALEYAHRNGVPAWNGHVATRVLLNRLSQLRALETAGFRVPEVREEPPAGEYVAKAFLEHRDAPTLGGEGDFYQPLLDTTGVDHKYYAARTDEGVEAAVVRCDSKLHGERRVRGVEPPDPAVVERIDRLLRFVDARALGVDLVEPTDGGELVAVDVNPATSFRRTGLERALADSMVACL